jgi:AbrB family looped-hinge helix DNA binding protein
VREVLATITSKGRVTIPVEVRQSLGLKKGDKIAFVIDQGGDVHLKPPRHPSIMSLRGAAGILLRPLSWQEAKEMAEEEHVAELRHKLCEDVAPTAIQACDNSRSTLEIRD